MQQHVSATHHQCNSCISHCCSLRFHKDNWYLVMSCRQAQQKSTLGSDFLGWGLAFLLITRGTRSQVPFRKILLPLAECVVYGLWSAWRFWVQKLLRTIMRITRRDGDDDDHDDE